jgi:hypothetical protein
VVDSETGAWVIASHLCNDRTQGDLWLNASLLVSVVLNALLIAYDRPQFLNSAVSDESVAQLIALYVIGAGV